MYKEGEKEKLERDYYSYWNVQNIYLWEMRGKISVAATRIDDTVYGKLDLKTR